MTYNNLLSPKIGLIFFKKKNIRLLFAAQQLLLPTHKSDLVFWKMPAPGWSLRHCLQLNSPSVNLFT